MYKSECIVVCVGCRHGELFDRLLTTDHVHNVVGVLCYLQSVTELLSTATSSLSSASADESASVSSACSIAGITLPLWTSVVTALQRHLNRVSCCFISSQKV